jgi:regulator of sigma E protease
LKVDEFGFGFPPRIAAWKKGETEYSINWLPFGGFVKLSGERGEFAMLETPNGAHGEGEASRLLYMQPAWKKSLVMLAGVIMNFILGWFFLSLTLMIGAPRALIISGVQHNSPAQMAHLMSGDAIKNFSTAQSFIDYVNAHRGQHIFLTVLRSNKEVTVDVVPRVKTGPDQGALGVALNEAGVAPEGFFPALKDGFITALLLVWLTLKSFGQLVSQLFVHATLLPGVVGPVGIFGIAQETGKIGLTYLLQFLGIISINLTVVNLLPFPALDGGRFLLVIIEKIKGSPLSPKVEGWINGLGFSFLIFLMILLTVRDVGNLL